MAKIVGNLVPDDDYMHPLGPEPNFNESMYFNFFDPDQSIGGFLRLGNRANEGHAEMTVSLFRADGSVLFMFGRPEIESNDAFAAGGCHFQVVDPTDTLRSVYEGPLIVLTNPRALADPSAAFKESPRCQAKIDLTHHAVGPMYGHARSRSEEELPPEQQFARAHYEQHMRVEGEIQAGDDVLQINGYGLRDHSWGPRHWQAIDSYEWLTMNFGEDFGVVVSIIRRPSGDVKTGVVVRGQELDRIVDAEIDARYESNGLYHREVTARVKTARGQELRFDGRVRGFLPLRNRRGGRLTHIGEGMTEWRCEERRGFGLSEFLRQVE